MADALPPDADRVRLETDGVGLHAVVAGPTDGRPVVLLHGFPEFWFGWREQIPALAEAGYRVIATDQRGYNRSDKPAGIDAYTIDTLAADLVGVLDALGLDCANVVGHDWGGGVLWEALCRSPDRIDRAAVINAPHPAVFRAFVRRSPRQLVRSWYMLSFQLPGVAERAYRAFDWRGLRWWLDTSNRPGTFTESVLERYREAWSRPGAFTAMLNWYRALFRGRVEPAPTSTVAPPAMLVWGTEDAYLSRAMAEPSTDHCIEGRLEFVEGATHWVHHEVPDRVNRLLIEFLDGR